MDSFGDVWHLGSEDLESLQVLGPCSAVSGALGGPSLLCRICSLWGPWGSTVSLAALFLPIPIFLSIPILDSLGDVWHLGSEDLQDLDSLQVLGPCSAGSAVSGALGGPQCHLLHSFFLSLWIP